jgi:hypothetical protein
MDEKTTVAPVAALAHGSRAPALLRRILAGTGITPSPQSAAYCLALLKRAEREVLVHFYKSQTLEAASRIISRAKRSSK